MRRDRSGEIQMDREISELHRVFIDGESCAVHACRVSALPFNVWWQGRQRPLEQTEEASFVAFPFSGDAEMRVCVKKPFQNAVVRPLSANVRVRKENGCAVFTIARAGQYVLETDGEHNALHIFADRAENFEKYGEPTLVFGAGEHRVGKIELKSHDRVFVHRDAIVHGSFYAKGATDIRIFGNGIVDGGWETRKSMHCYENYTNGCAKFYECTDITLDGVVFRDSAIWVVNLFDCEDVSLKNIKLVGHYKYNTDGVDIVNSRRVSISDCFIRSFDDAITLKGILQYKDKCVEDIRVENTICWCGWGRTLEIGLETVAPAYRRISFTDCDLIHNSAVALDIQAGDFAEISDVTFENVRVEYQSDSLPEVIHNPPEKQYDGFGKRHVPMLFCAENSEYFINDENYFWYDDLLKKERKGRAGSLKNVSLIGVRAVGDAGGDLPALRVQFKAPFTGEEILVSDLVVFGKKVGKEDCNVEGTHAHLLRFI